MRTITLSIGCVPCDEECAQTGVSADWTTLQRLEATIYRAALIAVHGPLPDGVTLPVMTYGHDFGSYIELEVWFDPDDEAAVGYADAVETGLATWMEAGFTAPVEYDRSQPWPGTRRTENDCIVAALVNARRLADGGYATIRETQAIENLTTAYPSCAEMAATKLASLAAPIEEVR